MIEPSSAEQAAWPDTTRDYVDWLRAQLAAAEAQIATAIRARKGGAT